MTRGGRRRGSGLAPGRGHPGPRSARLRRHQPPRHCQLGGRRGRRGGAPLRLRLLGIGGVPAPHPLRSGKARRGGHRRRRAPVRAHHRPADAGLRRGRRPGVHDVPSIPATVSRRALHRPRHGPQAPGPRRRRGRWPGPYRRQPGLLRQDLQPQRPRADHPARPRQAGAGAGRGGAAVPASAAAILPGARRRARARDEEPATRPICRGRLHQRRGSRLRRGRRGLRLCAPRCSRRPDRLSVASRHPERPRTSRRLSVRKRGAPHEDLTHPGLPSPAFPSAPWPSPPAPPPAAARPPAAKRSPTTIRPS